MSEATSPNEHPGTGERTLLERALGVVTEVKAGEGITALILTSNVFLLLTAYYVIKPVREGLILAIDKGAQYKSYMGAAIALSLLVLVPVYGAVADRVTKNKLVIGVTLFFASHLVIFYVTGKGFFAMADGGAKDAALLKLALAFFAWVGVFNMMLVAQFWAFANHVYTQDQGKRLFALIGIGASLGGVVGAGLTTVLVPHDIPKNEAGPRTMELLLMAAAILCASAALTWVTSRREAARIEAIGGVGTGAREQKKPSEDETKDDAKTRAGTFTLVARHPYLLYIALFSLVFTFVNTNGEFILSTLVKAAGAEVAKAGGDAGAYATSFYGSFFLYVNVAVMVVQTFLVSRIVKFGGLKVAFFILPAIALLDAVGIAFAPVLAVVRIGKIAENATDYSVNNTVRNMLWLPTTTEMKFKAKQAVDTFFVRMGDVASAALVFVCAGMLGWPVRSFALIDIGLVGCWLLLAWAIVQRNEKMTKEQGKDPELQADPAN